MSTPKYTYKLVPTDEVGPDEYNAPFSSWARDIAEDDVGKLNSGSPESILSWCRGRGSSDGVSIVRREIAPVPLPAKRKRKPGAKYTAIPGREVLPGEPCIWTWETTKHSATALYVKPDGALVDGLTLERNTRYPYAPMAIVKARRPRAWYRAQKAKRAPAIKVGDIVDYAAIPVGATFEPTPVHLGQGGWWVRGAYNRVKTATGHTQNWTDDGRHAECPSKGYSGPCKITALPE